MAIKKEAFKQVLAIVEKSAQAKSRRNRVFDFRHWFAPNGHKTVKDVVKHPCGTVGCLGGWGGILRLAKTEQGLKTRIEAQDGTFLFSSQLWETDFCAGFYGITSGEGNYLFYGDWHREKHHAPTADVIAKLKNIIKTGKVINPAFDEKYQEQTHA